MVVRISKGTFDPISLEDVERLAVEVKLALRLRRNATGTPLASSTDQGSSARREGQPVG